LSQNCGVVPKVLSEPPGCVAGDGAGAVDDLIDAARRYGDVLREPVFGDGKGLEKFLGEHFAGRHKREQFFFCFHGFHSLVFSMVINHFNIRRATGRPSEVSSLCHVEPVETSLTIFSFAVISEIVGDLPP
jgi:hypothetical protein